MVRASLLLVLALGCAASTSTATPSRNKADALAELRASMETHGAELDAEALSVADIEAQQAEHRRRLDELEGFIQKLDAVWAAIVRDYRTVAQLYQEASSGFQDAGNRFDAASHEYVAARNKWVEADRAWKLAALAIAAAHAIEVNRINQAAGGSGAQSSARRGGLGCDEGMSTQTYRRRFNVQHGYEVDHIVPRALGGSDHQSNYQVIPMSVNRQWSDTFNAAKCSAAGMAQCAVAIAISTRCGSFAGGIPTN